MLDLGEEVLRMPWREVTRVSLRKEFVLLAMQAGSNRRELCRRFGIAPKTGYKWLLRDAQAGAGGPPNPPQPPPPRSPAPAPSLGTAGGPPPPHVRQPRGGPEP